MLTLTWAVIWAAIGPDVKKYVAHLAEKLGDAALSEGFRKAVSVSTLEKVNRIFVRSFGAQLTVKADLLTLTRESYENALKVFLKNPTVQEKLLAPLDGETGLDYELLRGIWAEMRDERNKPLIAMPKGFDWDKLAKKYEAGVRRVALGDGELRSILQALAAIRTAEGIEAIRGPVRELDLERHAATIRQAYGNLKLGPLKADWEKYGRVPLEAIYVPQSVKTSLSGEESEGLGARPVMEALADARVKYVVLMGDPGFGKSTLLNYLALRWAGDPASPVALPVELRRAAKKESFLDYLDAEGLPKIALDKHLKRAESLFLLDGLDEVAEGRRGEMVSGIIRLAGDYPKARILVTTRINGYYPGTRYPEQFRDAGFVHLTLQKFEQRQIERFLQLWERQAPGGNAARLQRALAESAAVRELAVNPLLLTMMALLNRTEDLPANRVKLYERCAALLLEDWDLDKFPGKGKSVAGRLTLRIKMRLLEQAAAAVEQERTDLAGNMISEEKLEALLEGELKALRVREYWSAAADLIKMLRERNFMLGYLGDRQYAFIHRTFLEYFFARDLKYRVKYGLLDDNAVRGLFRAKWSKPEWREILRLFCGIAGTELTAKCVLELLGSYTGPEDHGAVILAAQCLREAGGDEALDEIRVKTHRALLEFMAMEEYLAYRFKFSGYKPMLIASLEELARGWRDDPDMFDFLEGVLASEKRTFLRTVAADELAGGWRDDPRTLPLLRERALHAKDWQTRSAAVSALANMWRTDQEVLSVAQKSAESDADENVRMVAVMALAQHWISEDSAPEFLKKLSRSDPSLGVRLMAAQMLWDNWGDDPEVRRFVLANEETAKAIQRIVGSSIYSELYGKQS